MKQLNVKHATFSGVIIYVLGVSAFISSFMVPILSDPELQANLVLMFTIIPAATLGAHLYYRRGHETHGFLLGTALFFVAMVLDAIITVPLFVIPAGGNHITFFTDPGFWLIAVEYLAVVVIYWQVSKVMRTKRMRQA